MLSDSDSEEEFVVICCLLIEEENNAKKRRATRLGVREICKKRKTVGEYHTLFPDLLEDESNFFQHYHMTPQKFYSLLEILKVELTKKYTRMREPVGPEERLAVCLRFLATGNAFRSLALTFGLGERTVRDIVYSTCAAIWKKLQPICMPEPDEDRWTEIEMGFSERWDFPNLLGAVEGKHVIIQTYNSNRPCGVVLLALVDANERFIYVDVTEIDNNSNGISLKNSNLGEKLSNNTMNFPPNKLLPRSNKVLPHVIAGDETFPLWVNLMRPYSREKAEGDNGKTVFNYKLNQARNVSGNAFEMLVKKFRIFERHLLLSHEHVNSVVLATCCLHNFLRDDTCYWQANDVNVNVSDMKGLGNLPKIGGNAPSQAIEIRDNFKDYFNLIVCSASL